MGLEDHPGYLGFTSEGVIAIHADWPIYPVEHGWLVALATLGSFPPGTSFSPLDDIDRCVLLLADNLLADEDPYSQRNFHVALWHEDVLELVRRRYAVGPAAVTERVHELNHRRAIESRPPVTSWPAEERPGLEQIPVLMSGEATPQLKGLPAWDTYDDEYEDWVCFPVDAKLTMTAAGWNALDEALARQFMPPVRLRARLSPILAANLYDTAVREMSVALEVAMREASNGGDKYGQRLVNHYCRSLSKQRVVPEARVKTLRGELRTAFRFVRNEYAHNSPPTTRARGLSLLQRMTELHEAVLALSSIQGPDREGLT